MERPEPAVERRPAPVKSLAEASTSDLTVQVVGAARAGGLLELTLAVINRAGTGGEAVSLEHLFAAAPADARTLADLAIVDTAGRKKCFVLRDAHGRPLCSTAIGDLKPGERRLLWVRFPLPAATTSSVTVLLPHLPPLSGVPVS